MFEVTIHLDNGDRIVAQVETFEYKLMQNKLTNLTWKDASPHLNCIEYINVGVIVAITSRKMKRNWFGLGSWQ